MAVKTNHSHQSLQLYYDFYSSVCIQYVVKLSTFLFESNFLIELNDFRHEKFPLSNYDLISLFDLHDEVFSHLGRFYFCTPNFNFWFGPVLVVQNLNFDLFFTSHKVLPNQKSCRIPADIIWPLYSELGEKRFNDSRI